MNANELQGEREAFEAWFKVWALQPGPDSMQAIAWAAFQAGRAALSASTPSAVSAEARPDHVGVGVDESGGLILIFTRAGAVESTQRLRPGEQVLLPLSTVSLNPSAEARDAARYRWLVEDHDTPEARIARRGITDRLCVMSKSAADRDIDAAMAPPAAVPEFNGWYCAHCQRGVDSSEVTFHEQHQECGRVITNDRPPQPAVSTEARDAALSEARDALIAARDQMESGICFHYSRHRGGAIWTICDDCGQKWADDRGGFQKPKMPKAYLKAQEAIARIDAAMGTPPADNKENGNG